MMDIAWCQCGRRTHDVDDLYCSKECRITAEQLSSSSTRYIHIEDTSTESRVSRWRALVRPGSPAPPDSTSSAAVSLLSHTSPAFIPPSLMRKAPKSFSTPAVTGNPVISKPPSVPHLTTNALTRINNSATKSHPSPGTFTSSSPYTPTPTDSAFSYLHSPTTTTITSSSSSSTASSSAFGFDSFLSFTKRNRRPSNPALGAYPASAPQPFTTSPNTRSSKSTVTPSAPLFTSRSKYNSEDDNIITSPTSLSIDIPPRRHRDPFDHYIQSQEDASQPCSLTPTDPPGIDHQPLDDWDDILLPCPQQHAPPVKVHPAYLSRGRQMSRTCT